MPSLTINAEGIAETLDAFRRLDADLRKEANSEIRVAAKQCASELVTDLQAAASASPTPVAQRVAASIKVKSDRFPTVSIGGSKRVGRRGAPASALMWGSEHGGSHFAAGPSGGYWIAPTVKRFEHSTAIPKFERALDALVRRHGLGG